MATKGRTPKHPKPHKGFRNDTRPNGKSSKKHPKVFDTISRKLVCAIHGKVAWR